MKMLLKSAGVALALATTAIPSTVFAQAAVPTLTVDIQRLFSESVAAKSASAQIKAKYEAPHNAAVAAYNSAATALNTQADAARKIMKPDGTVPPATQKSVGDAQAAAQAAGQRLEAMENEISNVERYVQNQILTGAQPMVEQVRNERHAAAVVPKASTLAADPAGDVTTTVIQRVDQMLKTVSINLPQQGAPGAAAGAQPQGR